ncbi:hypothetical protein PLICRDRAFT_42954 [Plicaturopsis crispa FD-325 SS-3]|nr:hypothetical protein PLICRDRAFT_42954 [Plicaturopsis crispa FD-325 SS-3]
MDQESFRKLLQTPRVSSNGSTPNQSRGSLLTASSSKQKTVNASQPAFKPRKVKKQADSQYRDRAAERRVGEGNDYAQVEAVLEDFERRAAESEDKDTVEQQRRYLGGDKDHTILVKGLDVALLEQNKARAAAATEDDDSLEQAFMEASKATEPKKRTRQDLLRELKEKRVQGGGVISPEEAAAAAKTAEEEARALEEAKRAGKFRPIGFKPIGAPSDEKTKRKKVKGAAGDGERKKKKRKVEAGTESKPKDGAKGEMLPPPIPQTTPVQPIASTSSTTLAEPEPEPMDEDVDIFAGAGEYEGFPSGDEDDEDDARPKDTEDPSTSELHASPTRRWIPTDDEPKPPPPTVAEGSKSHSPPPDRSSRPPREEEDDDDEEEQPTRLVPLQSSALPSIKEFLAMDEAVGQRDKRKKRKDKRKGGKDDDGDGDGEGGKKMTAEVRAERDYKRLKSYTDKKAGASGSK